MMVVNIHSAVAHYLIQTYGLSSNPHRADVGDLVVKFSTLLCVSSDLRAPNRKLAEPVAVLLVYWSGSLDYIN